MARKLGATSSSEKTEAIVQPARQLLQGQGAQPCAANSMARGSPSSLRQRWRATPRSAVAGSKPGTIASARVSSSSTASAVPVVPEASLIPRGGTLKVRSARSPRISRLVATIRKSGHPVTRRSTNPETASTKCSQLSRMSSVRRRASQFAKASSSDSSVPSPRRRADATRDTTRSRSLADATETNQTPSRKSLCKSLPSSRARRVFPVPPGPVRVTSRAPASASRVPRQAHPRGR